MAPIGLLAAACLTIVVLAVLRGGCTLGSNYLTIDVGQRMVNDLRTALYAHLQKLSLKFHYRQQTGDLLFRVMADTFSIQGMVMNGLLPLASAALMLLGMFVVMLRYDWKLACVALLVGPPLYLAISRLSGRIHGHATASRAGGERALQPRGDRHRGGEAGAGLRPRGAGGRRLPRRQRAAAWPCRCASTAPRPCSSWWWTRVLAVGTAAPRLAGRAAA